MCDECTRIDRIKRADQYNPYCVCGRHRINLRNEDPRCYECKIERGDYERSRTYRQQDGRCTYCHDALAATHTGRLCETCRTRSRLRMRAWRKRHPMRSVQIGSTWTWGRKAIGSLGQLGVALVGVAAWSWSAVAWGVVSVERVVISWAPESEQRYELRLQHFAHPDWVSLGTIEAATGTHTVPFSPPLPAGKTGDDRWICVEARNVTTPDNPSEWARGCNQVDAGEVTVPKIDPPAPPPPPPAPVPPPPPPPPAAGLRIDASSPDQVVITATVKDCPRVVTSTKGSTATTHKRTITCVR